MFEEKELWKQRLNRSAKELGKYLRYIFNGHIVIVMLFLIVTAAFYYQKWISGLSVDFPAEMIMAIVLALLVTHSPIYSLLLEPDKIFLLPLENQLGKFFQRNIVLSFFLQVYLLFLGLAVFMPLFAHVNDGDFSDFLPFLLLMCLVKLANLYIRWRVQYYTNVNVQRMDSFIRYMVNAVFLFLLFTGASWLFLLAVGLIYLFLYSYYHSQTRLKGLNWEYLIIHEEKRMMSFYRLANMFTDVPSLRERVKRRKWLDWLLQSVPFESSSTYRYLYLITFLRGGDYLGIFLRLSVIGMIAIYLLTFGYGQVLFVVLFMFLTGFQLVSLWKHHDNKIWIGLYPVGDSLRVTAFQRLLFILLSIQAVVLTLPLLVKGDWVMSVLSIFAGVLFSYIFVYIYNKKKLVVKA